MSYLVNPVPVHRTTRPRRPQWTGCYICALLLALLTAPAHAITITADHQGAVYIRNPGDPAWHRVADHWPASVRMPGHEADFMVEGRADFFHLWRGQENKVQDTAAAIQIVTEKVLDWRRILFAGVIPLATVVITVLLARLRILRRDTANLEGRLHEAQGYATLRPGVLPQRIGRFKVLDRLGTGGTATVFRVEDQYGDCYALKVPDPHLLDSPAATERFLREMDILRGLNHPGIVRIYDFHRGDAETPPFIAQELVGGETLKSVIENEAPFPVDRALEIARQVTDILAYAHSRSVVHRDIKPANIMLGKDLRVMDFGIAKAAELDTMTGTDMTLGTPAYMAPEQVNSRHATVRSDLYSVGVILFEMLTRRLPFEESDPYRLLVLKMREAPPRASSLRPDVPRRLDNLIALLLQADPEKRPESAEKVSRMLALLAE